MNWVVDLYVAGFAWAFAAHWLLTFALVGIIACWFLLATALNPSAFLPFGMAAVTLATVATSTFAQLMLAANTVKEVGESYPNHHPHLCFSSPPTIFSLYSRPLP